MGYLDNSSITVDAVLTKKGREILKESGGTDMNGNAVGGLNITSFTLSDTGVDYRLWNSDHPSGSAFYGEAIENLPMLEASVHAEYNLKNRLITLNKKAIAVPALILGSSLSAVGSNNITFSEGDENNGTINVSLVGMSSNAAPTGQQYAYYVVVQDPTIISTTATRMAKLSGTAGEFLAEEDINDAQQYGFNGSSFKISPIQQDTAGKQTHIYVVHIHSGAYAELVVTNNITKNQRAILANSIQGS